MVIKNAVLGLKTIFVIVFHIRSEIFVIHVTLILYQIRNICHTCNTDFLCKKLNSCDNVAISDFKILIFLGDSKISKCKIREGYIIAARS